MSFWFPFSATISFLERFVRHQIFCSLSMSLVFTWKSFMTVAIQVGLYVESENFQSWKKPEESSSPRICSLRVLEKLTNMSRVFLLIGVLSLYLGQLCSQPFPRWQTVRDSRKLKLIRNQALRNFSKWDVLKVFQKLFFPSKSIFCLQESLARRKVSPQCPNRSREQSTVTCR